MNDDDELTHIGTPRHSGRYPWGSGGDPEQRNTSFLGNVKKLHKQGLSDVEIAKGLGLKGTSELRKKKTIAIESNKRDLAGMALRLKEKGLSNVAIAKRMGGISDHTVAALLDPAIQEKATIVSKIADALESRLKEKTFVDIGSGTESHLGIPKTKLDAAVAMIEDKGKYKIQYAQVQQQGTIHKTSLKMLAPADMPYPEVYKRAVVNNELSTVNAYTINGGRTVLGIEPPQSVNLNRVHVRYAEDGGTAKDGIIELRRGVSDISLGRARYAQVRIAVNDSHFMKGMAMYSDDIPKGMDIVYNTKKPKGTPILGSKDNTVMKPMKTLEDKKTVDQDNPFGSTIGQRHYLDADGKDHLSALNVVGFGGHLNEEGTWGEWSKSLSSQVLSKQQPSLAKQQLGKAYDSKKQEYDEIMSLTNPAVKKYLLKTFSDECDSSAVDLDAAAMPRQASHVLLPFSSIKPNEVYAPHYDDGESVVLIRHPHGGIFEIPELIVNNKNQEAIAAIGKDAEDAVGIHPSVASKLSGADFDGDTVLVIPNKNGEIRTAPSLRALKDFDTIAAYPGYEGMPKLTDKRKQRLMGDVSNLITDMTIKAANVDEIARAVKHSMVVIDAEKHNLDYRKSEIENNIADLKRKYQGGARAGASTLISKSGSQMPVPSRKEQTGVDPVTGKKTYKYLTNQFVINSKGKKVRVAVDTKEEAARIGLNTYVLDRKKKVDPETGKITYVEVKAKDVPRTTKSSKMAEADNAFSLSSGTKMETVYAEHANKLKDLANTARLSMIKTEDLSYSHSAYLTYKKEVDSLNHKLNIAFYNKPLERQAQLLANKNVSARRQANPNMDGATLKKIKGQALTEARFRVGAKKDPVVIEDREWEAIQAGAISKNKLYLMLLNANIDSIKQRAMPRTTPSMSTTDISRARSMKNAGHSPSEIARALGVSTSTLTKALE